MNEKLELLLRELPDNDRDIAVFLQAQGVVGKPGDAEECPVAVYLAGALGRKVVVTYEGCAAEGDAVVTPLPLAVGEFVIVFDDYRYTKLISPDVSIRWR